VPVEAAVVVGIADNKRGEGIRVYPVPTQGVVNIEMDKQIGDLGVRVFNEKGQCVLKNRYSYATVVSLDLSAMPQGSYFLQLLDDGMVVGTQKLSVIR
jgi:hypothetical protein